MGNNKKYKHIQYPCRLELWYEDHNGDMVLNDTKHITKTIRWDMKYWTEQWHKRYNLKRRTYEIVIVTGSRLNNKNFKECPKQSAVTTKTNLSKYQQTNGLKKGMSTRLSTPF